MRLPWKLQVCETMPVCTLLTVSLSPIGSQTPIYPRGWGWGTLIFLYTYARVRHLPFIPKKCLEFQATEKNI